MSGVPVLINTKRNQVVDPGYPVMGDPVTLSYIRPAQRADFAGFVKPFSLQNAECFLCSKVGHTKAVHRAGAVFNVEDCVEASASEEDQTGLQTSDEYSLFHIASSRSVQSVSPLKLEWIIWKKHDDGSGYGCCCFSHD
ncbi:hypothetical protein E2C01_037065 [Portunus trituberculatus]|uniref:Uncharacterized protein n=1 Tax=Portunus trituberculatus TaxID=210409 RepID=A0A5B7FED5_PORTR|nr:hypothetical protein [Portunus trituberculatus]